MIDMESEIFSEIAEKAREKFPKLYMVGEYVKSPSSFPCVSLVEIDNAVYSNSQTQAGPENHAAVTYELNVYSNKQSGKKSECKAIAAYIDDLLLHLNFTRTMLEPVPNEGDATIYRMLGRYRAVIDRKNTIYRR